MGPGIRVDDGCVEGGEIPRFYDPMIAKVSAWGPDRQSAIARMDAALAHFEIAGIAHNVPYLRWVMASAQFQGGRYDTGIVAQLGEYTAQIQDDLQAKVFAALTAHRQGRTGGKSEGKPHSEWQRAARNWIVR
tara:strand:+ start:13 stop:411 length:399 start_codon:yes stop_codon:yes gene_type:complete